MSYRFIPVIIILCLISSALILLSGCEGAGKLDKETRDSMEKKLADWNENGFPISDRSAIEQTKGNLLEWRFKYAKLTLIFDSQKTQPVIGRMVLEAVALEWYNTYPSNIKPRFTMEVHAFHDIDSHDNEWGITKVKKDGTLETHWYPTDVV